MSDKYTVQDVFDFGVTGQVIDFESAVADVLAGKAAAAVAAVRTEVRSQMFGNKVDEPNDEPDLPGSEDENEED